MEHYKCIICGTAYEKEISLYAHITSHSQEIMVSETSPENASSSCKSKNAHEVKHSSMNRNKENRSPREGWPRTPRIVYLNRNPVKSLDSKQEYECQVKYNGKQYQCEMCFKTYKAKRNLMWHIQTMHKSVDFDFKCEICGKVYALHEQLDHHFKVSHSENVMVDCKACGEKVKKIYLKNHRKTHAALKDFKCSICNLVFQNKGELKCHVCEHTKEYTYECDTCKKCFVSKKVLLLHLLKTHLNTSQKKEDLKLEVKLGDKETDVSVNFVNKKHKKKRAKLDKPFKCDVESCQYATSQIYLLKAHKFKHNPFYKCVTCQKELPSRQELKIHMATHGERPYKCDQCSKCYKDKHGLGWHKKVQHDPSRLKFTCELCGKTYPFDSLLTQHINLTHATEKQSVCDICGKNVSKTYLPMHRRTHGEKQYSCDVCQKSFLEKAYLKRHKMIHTGEKPYVCNVCGNLFRQHSTLTIHMRTHTGDRPYKCVLCENAYKTHHNLKKHYRRSGHKIV